MFTVLLIFFAAILLLLVSFVRQRKTVSNFPPGPLSLPVIGGIYKLGMLSGDHYTASLKLMEDYGPLVGLDLGSYRCIVINDPKILKIIFNNPAVHGRPHDMTGQLTKFRQSNGLVAGIMSSSGETLIENRRRAMKIIRDFEKSGRMENAILAEVESMAKIFEAAKGGPVDSQHFFKPHIRKIIWTMMSPRKEHDEAAFTRAMNSLASKSVIPTPWTKIVQKISKNLTGWPHYLNCLECFDQFANNIIDQHKNDPCIHESDKDFVDLWLDLGGATGQNSNIDFEEFNLGAVMSDLVIGGVGTTSETLAWLLAILINFPKIQERIQQEIDLVVHDHEKVMLEHRPRLIWLEAFIKEVMRFRPVVSWTLPHRVTTDTVMEGYRVPKDTLVIGNFFAMCVNPISWPEPHIFRPERFLTPNGQELAPIGVETSMIFSSGRRACLGQSLAMNQTFLILANILKLYTITSGQNDGSLPSLKHRPLVILTHEPFQFIATPRRDVVADESF